MSQVEDSFLNNEKIKGKCFGVNLSVILHKSLGTDESAGEFHMIPSVPISKVEECCERLISLAK